MFDAFVLANVIEKKGKSSVQDMLKACESEMRPRTTKSVLASRSAGNA